MSARLVCPIAQWCEKHRCMVRKKTYDIHGRGLPRLVSVVRLRDITNNPNPFPTGKNW